MIFTRLKVKTQVNLLIQSIAMLVGTTTHLIWIIHNGFLSEKYNVHVFSRFFWDSLTFLDPLAAVLLILKPKTGIWITAIIIVVDVLHNGILCLNVLLTAQDMPVINWIENNWMLWCQLTFGLFVLLSLKSNLKAVRNQS